MGIVPLPSVSDLYKMDRKISYNMDSFYNYGEKSNIAMFMATILFMRSYKSNSNLFGLYEIDVAYLKSLGISTGKLECKLSILDMEQFKEYVVPIYNIFSEHKYSKTEIENLISLGLNKIKEEYLSLYPEVNTKLEKKRIDEVNNIFSQFFEEYNLAKEKDLLFDTVWKDGIYLLTKKVKLVRSYVGFNSKEDSLTAMSVLESVKLIKQHNNAKAKIVIQFRYSQEVVNGLDSNYKYLDKEIIKPLLVHRNEALLPLAVYLLDLRDVCIAKQENGTPNFNMLCEIANYKEIREVKHKKQKLVKALNDLNLLFPKFFPHSWNKYQVVFEFKTIENEKIVNTWSFILDCWLKAMRTELRDYFLDKYNVSENVGKYSDELKNNNSLTAYEDEFILQKADDSEIINVKKLIYENQKWDSFLRKLIRSNFELTEMYLQDFHITKLYDSHFVKEKLKNYANTDKAISQEALIKLIKFSNIIIK